MPSLNSVSPRSRDYWILAAITLLAALIRFIGLTRDSLWTDETFSGYASQLPSAGEVVRFISFDVHPPGYFVSLWAWAKIFGNSDYTLRAFSALAGVLLVPVAYRLGRQLFDSRTGLISAFLTALLIQGIYYSQEVRAYIWMALFSALSVSLLLDYMKSRANGDTNAWKWLIGVVAACSLNTYFHYFGLLFSALLITGLFVYDLRNKNKIWSSVAAGGAVILIFLPWVPVLLGSANKDRWIPPPSPKYIAETANILYGPGFLLVGVAFLVLLVGLALGIRAKKIGAKEMWLAAWILVPLFVSVAASILQKPVYTPRNMMLAFVAGSLLLARAITLLSDRRQIQWAAAIGIIAVMFGLHYVKGSGYLFRPIKQQVREAARFVEEHNAEKLPIYTVGWDRENFYYYLHGTDQLPLLKSVTESDVTKKGLPGAIPEERFWVASAGLDVNGIADLNKDFVIESKTELQDARAYLLRRKNALRAQ